MGGFAWVTLATNDSYSLGALVLAHSLRQVNTVHQLAVLVTPGVTSVMREKLASVFNVVVEVNILDSKDEANLRLLKRPELGVTFTKLHCWRLTQFEKCVFLDADTMVLANADELFDKEEFSAAPDVGWPDCFNSGVFVYRPSEETYSNIVKFALEKGSFDGGDQGLLNLYFSDWAHKDISKHLPFIYNTCSTACYSYLPAFKQFGGNVKIIHFIGSSKPWLQYFDSETRQVHVGSDLQHLQVVLQQWWNIFCSSIHPMLAPEMAGLAGAFARLTLGAPRTAEQAMIEDQLRRQGWEVGNIDYMGRDSFDNIWTKICETLSTASAPPDQEPSIAVPSEGAKQAPTVNIAPTPAPESVSQLELTKPQATQLSEDAGTQQSAISLSEAPKEVPVAKLETVTLESKCGITEDTEKPVTPITPTPISEYQTNAPSSVTPAPTTPTEQIVSLPKEPSSKPIALPDSPTVCELSKSAPSLQKPAPPQAETQITTISPATPQPTTSPVSVPAPAPEAVSVPPQPEAQKPIPLSPTKVAPDAPTPSAPKAVSEPHTPIPPQAEAQKPIPLSPTKVAPDAPTPSAPKAVSEPHTPIPPQAEAQKPTTDAAPPMKPDEKEKAQTLLSSTKVSPDAPAPSVPKAVSEPPTPIPPQAEAQKPTVETSKPVPPVKPAETEKAHTSPSLPKVASDVPKAVAEPLTQKPTPAPAEVQKSAIATSKPVPIPTKSDDKEKAPTASSPSKATSKTSAKPAPAKPADPKPTTPPADAGPTPPPRKGTAGGGSASKKPSKGGKK